MRYIAHLLLVVLTLHGITFAQKTPSLMEFFTRRLSAAPGTPAPSYEALLAVTDTIAATSPKEVEAALPLLSAALKRDKGHVAVEALMALHSITLRPDGGVLLRTRVPKIAPLLNSDDERLSGGAIVILRRLTGANSDLTIPIMIGHLTGRGKPSFVKADIVSALLDARPNDPQSIKAIEEFLGAGMEPQVQIATLNSLAQHHADKPAFNDFAIRALDSKNKHIQMAAIYAVHALPSAYRTAQPKLTNMATDTAEDKEVRQLADKAIRGNLTEAPKQ